MITSPESLGITDPGIRAITVESGDRRLIPADRNVGIEVDATKIWKDYDDNEVAADLAYKGKTLRVTGVVRSIDMDFLGNMILHLKSPGLVTHVMATLRDSESAKASSLRKGVKIVLLCTGGGLVIGAPILDDCTVDLEQSI